MIGKIIEIEQREGLFLVVDYKDNETDRDFQYVQDFWLIPYEPSVDNLEVNLKDTEKYKLRGLKMTVTICADKKPFKKYGYSVIRGIKTVYFERTWDEPVFPSR